MDLESLEQIARGATPGPWNTKDMGNVGQNDEHEIWIEFDDFSSLAAVRHGADDEEYGGEKQLKANAEYIATFNPELILKILAELKIYKTALKSIAGVTDSDIEGKWVSEYHLRDEAKEALELARKETDEDL
jgi:hypothetical protein